MNEFYSINPIGELYIPAEFRDSVFARGSVKLFAHQELDRPGTYFHTYSAWWCCGGRR